MPTQLEQNAMNFGFSAEQEMLRESARKFLDSACPITLVRKMVEDETGHSGKLWKELAAMGWLGLLIPPKFGGVGGTFLDATVILEEMGKTLFPGPFLSTALLGATALTRAGSTAQKKEILPRVADGSSILALAWQEGAAGQGCAGDVRLAARRKGAEFMLRGEKRFVWDAVVADWLIVAARTARVSGHPERGITLFLVERGAPGLAVAALPTIDKTRRLADVSFDGVPVPRKRVLGRLHGGWPILARALEVGTTAVSVETVGVAQRALDLSVQYARDRTQFGKPIGSFQAVKHKCVDMMVAVENARSLAYYAAWAVEAHKRESLVATAMAKAYASEMGKSVAGDAIQIHGGIGFTWEHDLHLYYRRTLANEVAFGAAPLHREAVAKQLNL
jgi:alkylation response protein AidB-like acyl-CoA dehydrogenase